VWAILVEGPSWAKGRSAEHIFNQDGHQAKNRKKRGRNLKKSSPLKLLSQSQPNFAEMILGWSHSKIVFYLCFVSLHLKNDKMFTHYYKVSYTLL
jgi:hypothetical protein